MQCIHTYWALVGPVSNSLFVCALYRLADASLELRAGLGEEDPLLRQRVHTQTTAEAHANAWKVVAESQGFRDVDC